VALLLALHQQEQLFRNSDMFWKPTMAVQADVGSFILAVSQELCKKSNYQQPISWTNQLKQSDHFR